MFSLFLTVGTSCSFLTPMSKEQSNKYEEWLERLHHGAFQGTAGARRSLSKSGLTGAEVAKGQEAINAYFAGEGAETAKKKVAPKKTEAPQKAGKKVGKKAADPEVEPLAPVLQGVGKMPDAGGLFPLIHDIASVVSTAAELAKIASPTSTRLAEKLLLLAESRLDTMPAKK
jgi:hypothetical protein